MYENKNKNSAIGFINKDLIPSINAITEVSGTIQAINLASRTMSDSITAFSAIGKSVFPFAQINKMYNYIKIAQIPNLYVPQISKVAGVIGGFSSKIEQISTNMDEICSILAEYNYLLPLNLPLSSYSYLLKYLNNTKKYLNREKEIDKLLLKLFSRKKWEMESDIVNNLRDNNKINNKRIVILEDCINVLNHNSRRTAANTILPVLIAQIEGVWVDILGSKDKSNLKNIVLDMKIDKYTNPAMELLTDILFQYTKMKFPVKPDFCRNKILHGEEVEYGSIHNVIRAFLIIEFLDFIKTDDELKEETEI